MPRGTKRGGHRGNSQRGGSRGGRVSSALETRFVPFSGTASPRGGHNGFTLADEARNTEQHQSSWDSDRRLRFSKVSFVSAGTLSKDDSQDVDTRITESALADMSLDSPVERDSEIQVEVVVEIQDETDKDFDDTRMTAAMTTSYHPESSTTAPPNFVVYTRGDTVNTGLPPPRIRSPSPTPSDSSEEVILFAGRNSKGKALSRATQTVATATDPFDAKIQAVEERIHQQEELLEEVRCSKSRSPSLCKEIMTQHSIDFEKSPANLVSVQPEHSKTRGNHQPAPRSLQKDEVEPSSGDFEAILPRRTSKVHHKSGKGRKGIRKGVKDAIFADYVANIDSDEREFLVQASTFNNRELGGTEDEPWQDETEMSSGEPRPSKEKLKGGWDASNIEDLDDLSTSDGVMGEVQAIFSKRERNSGLQYLVVWEDQTMDEARWVPATTLTSVGAQARIEEFEAEEKLVAQFAAISDEDDEDDEDESMDSEDMDDEDSENDADLLQRKIDRLDDEQIARLLAKQEELGMGSNKLLLFDDAADADEEDGFAVPNRSFNTFILPSTKRTRSKRPRGEFPAAAALADAYDGFDVMDFERPSLKKKPKGRKGKLILDDVSDSELEESMQAAWDNDRIKKKERKQEREELRAQGLLGKKNGKPDLKQKYKEGMSMTAVKEEIKRFLMSDDTTLALPPMEKDDRKIVHDIANAFNLKSKSAGGGKNRFPILTRTIRTSAYVERTFAQVESRLNRRFMPRIDVGTRGNKKAGGRGGGGFNSAAVSYRDGDVVGGSAPELGAENRGRAMLEKMGWSQGTALGALNNKGILQPVSHIVKTTKAGLG